MEIQLTVHLLCYALYSALKCTTPALMLKGLWSSPFMFTLQNMKPERNAISNNKYCNWSWNTLYVCKQPRPSPRQPINGRNQETWEQFPQCGCCRIDSLRQLRFRYAIRVRWFWSSRSEFASLVRTEVSQRCKWSHNDIQKINFVTIPTLCICVLSRNTLLSFTAHMCVASV